MVQYKWIALSNTTISILMAFINQTILIISLPAIFRGIDLNPFAPGSFVYLLWIIMGYNIVTATLLVTFGRLSDIFGRTRLYNMGFLIFTIGSILLFLTPGKGTTGALELILFRLVQAVGGAFLMANSAAILTDAFPPTERGKALGLNQVAGLSGSFIGLLLGGILATINWRFVFLVSVPVGILGTVWSYLKLKDVGRRDTQQKIDYVGNMMFAAGLTSILVGATYGLMPYGKSTMGWGNPLVIAAIVVGAAVLVAFVFVEKRVRSPMFRMELFKIRPFTYGTLAGMLSSIGRGGLQFMLIILLQGIWLPLHGYAYSVTPFWAGVYMLPLTAGFLIMGPLSGALSDKYGARFLATFGMVVAGVAFIILALLPYNFVYIYFALVLLVFGLGSGMFASPNSASIMNSVPPETRGAASGMRTTMQNAGMTASLAIFFSIVILDLSYSLPHAFASTLTAAGASSLVPYFSNIPPTSALFSAFLGYNPVGTILSSLPSSATSGLSASVISTLESNTWFPHVIAPAFMKALHITFYFGMALSFIAAVASAMRGKKYVHDLDGSLQVQRGDSSAPRGK
ncbi:MFS transporter [Thermogymnomonas acidicola]|uniref:MFS transporter n=1 Tax=Thermogymnomonas acidicola TaxID=399579 RepID=A0AA37BS09_9ARCH|nr:MFS transporter [Thermogymnomonas acidicola]GGM75975.1 MFS transporter [Thermogymnomonas acidicola]